MLHILNKPPHSEAAQQLLLMAGGDDVIVLIEAGVLALLDGEWQGFRQCQAVYTLSEDVLARGLQQAAVQQGISMIDYSGFVALTEKHTQSITWY